MANLKVYIGIDPGATGAIAIITTDMVMAIMDFDNANILPFLRSLHRPLCKAVIEKVNAMPGQGVSSTFKFGVNFGTWIGRLETLRIRFDYVTPQKWQKIMFDSMPRGDKSQSINRALRIFPNMADFLKRKKDHNRADALLLAEYARITDR